MALTVRLIYNPRDPI